MHFCYDHYDHRFSEARAPAAHHLATLSVFTLE